MELLAAILYYSYDLKTSKCRIVDLTRDSLYSVSKLNLNPVYYGYDTAMFLENAILWPSFAGPSLTTKDDKDLTRMGKVTFVHPDMITVHIYSKKNVNRYIYFISLQSPSTVNHYIK